MQRRISPEICRWLSLILLLSVGCVIGQFLWQGHKGFSLWDEGFLWYGTQRVMVGEVPIRDFMAYDPGRYYWSAGLMSLVGDNGVMTLRVSVALFQAMGLSVGLALIASASRKTNALFLTMVAVTLVLWMYPRHKLFDASISILLVGVLSCLVAYPNARSYFFTGVVVGLVAVFGRNHGVYGVVGSVCVIAYLSLVQNDGPKCIKAISCWVVGVVVGYIPILVSLFIVPGFASAFWDSILLLFEHGSTNNPLPVPWPWRAGIMQGSAIKYLRNVMIGVCFIAILAYVILGIGCVVRQRARGSRISPVIVASIALSLPYAHYAYSRADLGHLALGIFPFLIGSFALLATQRTIIKWPVTVFFLGASILVMLPVHPGWQCNSSGKWVEKSVAGDVLQVSPGTAKDLAILEDLVDRFASGDRSFIATPFWPGAYAVYERKSPMWEIYALGKRSEDTQRREIERIKTFDPGFVLIFDYPLDGREDLLFNRTHPLVDQYFRDHFHPLDDYTDKPMFRAYKRKGS